MIIKDINKRYCELQRDAKTSKNADILLNYYYAYLSCWKNIKFQEYLIDFIVEYYNKWSKEKQ